jgi:hypothetical protein
MKCRERIARLEEALQITLARATAAEVERARLEAALEALSLDARMLAVRAANATLTPEKFDALIAAARHEA